MQHGGPAFPYPNRFTLDILPEVWVPEQASITGSAEAALNDALWVK
jgi:hypothetical protein